MNDGVKRLKRRKNRGIALIFVEWERWVADWLTCCRWCRHHCFPPHTAPVLGKHAEPVEQSGPGKVNHKSWKWIINWVKSHIALRNTDRNADMCTCGGTFKHKYTHRQAGCTCCWTGTCWVEPVGWTGTVVCRGTVEVESAPASGVCMAPKQKERKQSYCRWW